MIRLDGYRINNQIYESSNSRVYRGIRNIDGQAVILKLLQDEYPSAKQLANYRQEYEMTKSLDIEGLVKVYGLLTYRNSLVMVIEDFGGESLAKLNIAGQIGLDELLRIAIEIAKALGALHQAFIVHKDIKPANIVYNREMRTVKLIDLGISTQLSRSETSFRNPNELKGTLTYISPEQTGRMNRAVDLRTDFYSLGVTLYELLTGQLPFTETEPLALVHAHIAKAITPPAILQPDIPPILSDLIMKLLSKNAEDRYQSAYGLQIDLEQCLRQWQAQTTIEPFTLAQSDKVGQFQLPQKLYGRSVELALLSQSFARVNEGGKELVLVAGYSGVGKSALVQEMYRPITEKAGYFIQGKFDQYQRNVPYTAISQAFSEWVTYLMTEPEAELIRWKAKILEAVGTNGQVLLQVIPQLALLIGKQPDVLPLGPAESQNRFNYVFQQFVRIIAQTEHPLVLFVDDLQWADNASLSLLQTLLTDEESHHFLVLGAYRDNEVHETHPFMLLVNELSKAEAILNIIKLENLQKYDLLYLTADTLHCQPNEVRELTELVYEKTQGNAFFVRRFLQTLYEQNLINFIFTENSWQWDVAKIRAQDLSDNVVELLINKIQKLAVETQTVLQLAACMGNQFELQMLALVYKTSPAKTFQQLWSAIKEGLIIPLDENYQVIKILGDDNHLVEVGLRFAHDRVQQASYALIPEDKRTIWHLDIGRILLANHAEDDEILFDIVDHLNEGQTLITNATERLKLAELNLQVGKQAKEATAYRAAQHYFRIGLDLLGDNAWHTHYILNFEFHKYLGETALLLGYHNKADEILDIALQNAQSKFDKVSVYIIKIAQYTIQGNYTQAISFSVDALNLFNLNIPITDDKEGQQQAIEAELDLYQKNMATCQVSDLFGLPTLIDKEMIACNQILMAANDAAVIGEPDYLTLYTAKTVNLSIKYGLSEYSAVGYVYFGLILGAKFQDYESAYQISIVATKLVDDRFYNPRIQPKVYHISAQFATLKNHLQTGINIQKQAYRIAMDVGDLAYAAYAITGIIRPTSPLSLYDFLSESDNGMTFCRKTNNVGILSLIQMFYGFTNCLQNKTKGEKISFDFADFTEASFVETFSDSPLFMGFYKKNKLIAATLFEDYENVLELALTRADWLGPAAGLDFVHTTDVHLYSVLILLALYPQADQETQQTYRIFLDESLELLKTLVGHTEINFNAKYLLLRAEKARLEGHDLEAMHLYNQAIDHAREHALLQSEAIGYELAAKLYLAKGLEGVALTYLREAHYTYDQWGATAKVKALEEQYPAFLIHPSSTLPTLTTRILPATTFRVVRTTTTNPSPNTTFSEQFLENFMQITQAISSEIILGRLLEKIMRIAVENVGAQRGLLILQTGDQWLVQAKYEINPETMTLLQAIPIEHVGGASQNPELSLSIINYVIRTQENVVLNDATKTERFIGTAYIDKIEPKSVLCIPLLNQGDIRGVLYLENNLSKGAFTEERLTLLTMLSSQIAVSLDNSLRYTNLEHLVEQRTMELEQTLTNLKTTQNQLIESEKLSVLGNLVAGVAQEINTPVGIGVTTASTLADKSKMITQTLRAGKLGQKALEVYLNGTIRSSELILNNLERANSLAQSFKQIVVDQLNLERRRFELMEYIEDILLSLKPQLKHTAHTIRIEGHSRIEVESYPGVFSQIITNLVLNSIQHGYDEGEAGELVFRVGQVDKQAEIQYQDNGRGISPENLSKIFEPFFTTEQTNNGTGVGLHIIYNLITKKLGGTIHCTSKVGTGTTFIVRIPCH